VKRRTIRWQNERRIVWRSKEGSKVHPQNGGERSRTTRHEQIAVAVRVLLNGWLAHYELQPMCAPDRERMKRRHSSLHEKIVTARDSLQGHVGGRDLAVTFG